MDILTKNAMGTWGLPLKGPLSRKKLPLGKEK
jgi:hypothetical protein